MRFIVPLAKGVPFVFLFLPSIANGQSPAYEVTFSNHVRQSTASIKRASESVIALHKKKSLTPAPPITFIKESKFYFRISFLAARFPLQNLSHYPAARFGYSYSGETENAHTYSDSTKVKSYDARTALGGSMEFGKSNGWFAGMSIGGFSIADGSLFASFQFGYNIPLVKRFTLQPSISFTNISVSSYLQAIPSNKKDISALGKVYPYKSCGCASPSEYLKVSINNNINFLQYKLAINYTLSRYITLRFGASLWTPLYEKINIHMENNSTGKTIRSNTYTARNYSPSHENGNSSMAFYWETSVLLKLGVRSKKPRHFGGSHHSSGTFHFHSSSCWH